MVFQGIVGVIDPASVPPEHCPIACNPDKTRSAFRNRIVIRFLLFSITNSQYILYSVAPFRFLFGFVSLQPVLPIGEQLIQIEADTKTANLAELTFRLLLVGFQLVREILILYWC
jgi:hypothetical protein